MLAVSRARIIRSNTCRGSRKRALNISKDGAVARRRRKPPRGPCCGRPAREAETGRSAPVLGRGTDRANGLVSMAFRAEGLTVDRAFALLTDRLDRHDAHVLLGQPARRDGTARNTIGAGIRASSEDPEQNIDNARRLNYLAERLARERGKTTTLGLVDVVAQQHSKRTQSRAREPSHEL